MRRIEQFFCLGVGAVLEELHQSRSTISAYLLVGTLPITPFTK